MSKKYKDFIANFKGEDLVICTDFENEIPEFGIDDDDMRVHDNYLVFAKNCRWNGASGYKFAKSFRDAVSRSYDTIQILENISGGGKAVLVSEYSHDVPQGGTTVIVSLTDREYRKLQKADFEKVQEFAETYIRKLR